MNLAQWEAQNSLVAQDYDESRKYLADVIPAGARPLLWALEDWRVSSVVGGAIWLCRRSAPNAPPAGVQLNSSLLPGDAVINLQTRALGVIVSAADAGYLVRSDCELVTWPAAEICVH